MILGIVNVDKTIMSLPLIALVEDEPMQRANAERALRTTAKITHYGSAEALLKDAMLPLYQLIVQIGRAHV